MSRRQEHRLHLRATRPSSLSRVLVCVIAILALASVVDCREYVTVSVPASIRVLSCEQANLALQPTPYSYVNQGILNVRIVQTGALKEDYHVFSVVNNDDEPLRYVDAVWTGNLTTVIFSIEVIPSEFSSGQSGEVHIHTTNRGMKGTYVGEILVSFRDSEGREFVNVTVPTVITRR
jgi:hypothetical protein